MTKESKGGRSERAGEEQLPDGEGGERGKNAPDIILARLGSITLKHRGAARVNHLIAGFSGRYCCYTCSGRQRGGRQTHIPPPPRPSVKKKRLETRSFWCFLFQKVAGVAPSLACASLVQCASEQTSASGGAVTPTQKNIIKTTNQY